MTHGWRRYAAGEWIEGFPVANELRTPVVFFWKCSRCGSTITAVKGSLDEAFQKDTDCDMALVAGVMGC